MSDTNVLILAAMQMEARAIARALRLRFDSPTSAAGEAARLHVVGVGAPRLPVIPRDSRAVILAGLAGGLDPSLRCGDVVIDDPSGILAPAVAAGARRGGIYGADRIISNAAEKAKLFPSTGMLAVDMESGPVRAAAAARSVSFINIRAVVDTADDPLDHETVNLLDESGRVKIAAAMKLFLRRPHVFPALLKTRAKATGALGNMSRIVAEVVRANFS